MASQTIPDVPYDPQAEKATVGALLIDPMAIFKVVDLLQPGDFYIEQNRLVYEAIAALHLEQAPFDLITIGDRLDQTGKLVEVGGMAYLTQLLNETPSSLRARHYARIVNRLGTLRRLVDTAGLIAKLAYSAGSERLDAIFAKTRQLVDAVAPVESDEALLLWAQSLDWFMERQLQREVDIKAREENKISALVDFPWYALRRFVSYLRPGMMGLVAAESSVGKTTFLECCAEYWARRGLNVVFFHLELSHQFMMDRRMVRQSGEPLRVIESGEITRPMDDATAAMELWHGGVHYVHCPGWTASMVTTKARQLYQKGLCDVGIVDYLQKIRRVYRQSQNDASALGAVAEMIKTAGEQIGIPFMLASQFSKASRRARRKTAEFIRDSGEPEEKANVIITLDREILEQAVYDDDGEVVAQAGDRSPLVKVRVDKNTAGPTGDTALIMNAARFLILDKAREGVLVELRGDVREVVRP